MLDPDCGFCYRENGTSLFDTSCVPVSQGNPEKATWGRWGTERGHFSSTQHSSTFSLLVWMWSVGHNDFIHFCFVLFVGAPIPLRKILGYSGHIIIALLAIHGLSCLDLFCTWPSLLRVRSPSLRGDRFTLNPYTCSQSALTECLWWVVPL